MQLRTNFVPSPWTITVFGGKTFTQNTSKKS